MSKDRKSLLLLIFEGIAKSHDGATYTEWLQKHHPARYRLILLLGIIVLFLPISAWLIITLGIFPTPNSAFLIFGVIGSFLLGIGLFNLCAKMLRQYMGHAVTALCFLLGVTGIIISCIVLYIPSIYASFNEQMATFCVILWAFHIYTAIQYFLFRDGLHSHMRRRGITERQIDILKEGKRNFWFYRALHDEYGLGFFYHINRMFLWLAIPFFLCLALLGLFSFMRWPLVTWSVAIHILSAAMSIFSTTGENLKKYGKPFVFWKKAKGQKRPDTILYQLGTVVLPLLFAQVEINVIL
ncbi:MAG: hypothetical protein J6D31_02140 [Clostridia bacterium]|nr:hypothetical protein [Clostridia bacterium]